MVLAVSKIVAAAAIVAVAALPVQEPDDPVTLPVTLPVTSPVNPPVADTTPEVVRLAAEIALEEAVILPLLTIKPPLLIVRPDANSKAPPNSISLASRVILPSVTFIV